eukprot:TRINITY_DN2384_c0_g1_i1.p1 TRINITY_DN2384_c0_g1~~TRINITY_DN2384_c0_g1_i1.p1  ORF type:complete len:594 (+),score=30.31 TRINITY_DN2384_c0_g1_i1:583-2364(+)
MASVLISVSKSVSPTAQRHEVPALPRAFKYSASLTCLLSSCFLCTCLVATGVFTFTIACEKTLSPGARTWTRAWMPRLASGYFMTSLYDQPLSWTKLGRTGHPPKVNRDHSLESFIKLAMNAERSKKEQVRSDRDAHDLYHSSSEFVLTAARRDVDLPKMAFDRGFFSRRLLEGELTARSASGEKESAAVKEALQEGHGRDRTAIGDSGTDEVTASRKLLQEDLPQFSKSSFDMEVAARLWDEQIGCDTFRKRHSDVLDVYGKGGPETWPKSGSFQNKTNPDCKEMKMRHVTVLVKHEDWFHANWQEGFHTCERCGLTCQFTWAKALLDTPDAELHVQWHRPPEFRRTGEPLRVFMSLEAHPWTKLDRFADIGIDFSSQKDVQCTYAYPEEGRRHLVVRDKLADTPIYRAYSNCGVKWRHKISEAILKEIPHHSFGRCANNVGGHNREILMFPECNYTKAPGFQEMGHCVMSHYKFVLAMENSRVPNYVTEKMYMPLEAGSVPVYFGAPDAANYVPPESFIDGDSFKKTEDLIEYLKMLDKDPVAYMNYFAWRRCGVLGNLARARSLALDSLPCRLCEKVSAMGGRQHSDDPV